MEGYTTMTNLFSIFDASQIATIFLLYAGPDQILPLVSVLGALMGILLIWWQRVVALIRRVVGSFRKSHEEVESNTSAKIGGASNQENIPTSAKR
jgi:hypothetical protein